MSSRPHVHEVLKTKGFTLDARVYWNGGNTYDEVRAAWEDFEERVLIAIYEKFREGSETDA